MQIYFANIWSKIFLKIFFPIFLKKCFQKVFSILKCYTILESWDQKLDLKNFGFGFAKTIFAVPGGNFARKKILQNQKILKSSIYEYTYIFKVIIIIIHNSNQFSHRENSPSISISNSCFKAPPFAYNYFCHDSFLMIGVHMFRPTGIFHAPLVPQVKDNRMD